MSHAGSDVIPAELRRLAGTDGVRLAVAASVSEGLVLHAEGPEQAIARAAAALGSALVVRSRAAAAACGHAEPRLLRLHCSEGQLLAAVSGPTVVIAVARATANAGRIRLQLLRAAEALT